MYRSAKRLNCKLCKLTFFQIVILIIVTVVLWNEYLSFWWSRCYWTNQLKQKKSKEEIKILFVADPQLQGYHDTYLASQMLSDIAIWDADRYLSHGFDQAYSYMKPDVVVFLGDLLDEGSTAIDLEYKEAVDRFYRIFKTDEEVQNIYIWGDNDVGGEGLDRKTEEKVNRFKSSFPAPVGQFSDTIRNVFDIDFIKLNLDWSETLHTLKINYLKKVMQSSKGKFKILINHMDVLYNQRIDVVQNVMQIVKPNIMVSAHMHQAMYLKCLNCATNDFNSGQRAKIDITSIHSNEYFNIPLTLDVKTQGLNEIMVPTCSYRMGTEQMGYGAAILDKKNNEFHYSVLWLPSRHKQFLLYVLTLICVLILIVIKCGMMLLGY